MQSTDGIAAYCRRKGISDVLFYQWKKQLLNNADSVFNKTSTTSEKQINRLKEDLQR